MKTYRTQAGPFAERPFFELAEIERICADELEGVELHPAAPEPVRIERFIERRFSVTPSYDELPRGVLGFTKFGKDGVEAMVVARALAEEGTRSAERRVNTTLAHEAGHCLLHSHLFVLGSGVSLFGTDSDPTRILCREEAVPVVRQPTRKLYDGRWWEFQANQAMGALLLPRRLVALALQELLVRRGVLRTEVLPPDCRDEAVERLSETFDVNPIVARIRLAEVYPRSDDVQLTL